MKELNTVQSLIITILIIIATSLISINSREVDSNIITIEKGMSLNSVSKLLLDENIIVDENVNVGGGNTATGTVDINIEPELG